MIQQVLVIGLFGGLGSMLRYGCGFIVKQSVAINVLGSFAIGIISMLPMPDFWRTALMVGLLGGFTTFSAFSLETVTLLQRGMSGSAAVYMASSVLVCVASCWLGRVLLA